MLEHGLDQSAFVAAMVAFIGGVFALVVYLVRISSMMTKALTKFDIVTTNQGTDIGELKRTVATLGELMIKHTQLSGRLDGQAQRATNIEETMNQRFSNSNENYQRIWNLLMEIRQGKGFVVDNPFPPVPISRP